MNYSSLDYPIPCGTSSRSSLVLSWARLFLNVSGQHTEVWDACTVARRGTGSCEALFRVYAPLVMNRVISAIRTLRFGYKYLK